MSKYSQAAANRICEALGRGEKLSLICGPDRGAGLPGQATFHQWMAERPEFRQQVEWALEAKADHLIEEMIEIADGVGKTDAAKDVARDKLRIDMRKWLVGKLAPGRFGDKAAPAVVPKERTVSFDASDDVAMAAKIAAILESARMQQEGLLEG